VRQIILFPITDRAERFLHQAEKLLHKWRSKYFDGHNSLSLPLDFTYFGIETASAKPKELFSYGRSAAIG
jgi:hypothetical protein